MNVTVGPGSVTVTVGPGSVTVTVSLMVTVGSGAIATPALPCFLYVPRPSRARVLPSPPSTVSSTFAVLHDLLLHTRCSTEKKPAPS
ncbi:hypothetical protein AB0J43_13715 [Nonomuraea fuscirosea]